MSTLKAFLSYASGRVRGFSMDRLQRHNLRINFTAQKDTILTKMESQYTRSLENLKFFIFQEIYWYSGEMMWLMSVVKSGKNLRTEDDLKRYFSFLFRTGSPPAKRGRHAKVTGALSPKQPCLRCSRPPKKTGSWPPVPKRKEKSP